MTHDEALTHWRNLRDLQAAHAPIREATRVEIGRLARALYSSVATPKVRAKMLPAPATYADLRSADRQWRELLTEAQIERVTEAVSALGARLAMLQNLDTADHDALTSAAHAILRPLEGFPMDWHRVEHVSIYRYSSQGLGSGAYAQAAASLVARDMIEVGYVTRCITRTRKGASEFASVSAYEVYVLTSEEGALIAPHQRPDRTLTERLCRARDEGVNAAALTGVPIEYVMKAGAAGCPQNDLDALRWERFPEDAPLDGGSP